MPHVRLGHQRDRRAPAVEQRLHLGVIGHCDAGPPGRTERHQVGALEVSSGASPGEELGVLGQRPRPAALDEPDPELVEQPGDRQLVGDRVRDAFTLGAVSQGGVVDVERVVRTAGVTHVRSPPAASAAPPAADTRACIQPCKSSVRPCWMFSRRLAQALGDRARVPVADGPLTTGVTHASDGGDHSCRAAGEHLGDRPVSVPLTPVVDADPLLARRDTEVGGDLR